MHPRYNLDLPARPDVLTYSGGVARNMGVGRGHRSNKSNAGKRVAIIQRMRNNVVQRCKSAQGNKAKDKSKRLQYMGKTPGKNSKTGRQVIARMKREGKIRKIGGQTQFLASDGKWYSLSDADMAHRIDAVTWWNLYGRAFGPKSEEVREFMLDPDNYYLEHRSINRSQGARLKKDYLPPLCQ